MYPEGASKVIQVNRPSMDAAQFENNLYLPVDGVKVVAFHLLNLNSHRAADRHNYCATDINLHRRHLVILIADPLVSYARFFHRNIQLLLLHNLLIALYVCMLIISDITFVELIDQRNLQIADKILIIVSTFHR